MAYRDASAPGAPADVTWLFHDRAGPSLVATADTRGAETKGTRWVLEPGGAPLAEDNPWSSEPWAQRGHYVSDPRGNLTQVVAGSGLTLAKRDYDPFGVRVADAPEPGWERSPLGFQMGYTDPNTATLALGPRLYDPKVRRFTSSDTYHDPLADLGLATDPLTANRYLYAGANPIGMIDDGHRPEENGWLPGSHPCERVPRPKGCTPNNPGGSQAKAKPNSAKKRDLSSQARSGATPYSNSSLTPGVGGVCESAKHLSLVPEFTIRFAVATAVESLAEGLFKVFHGAAHFVVRMWNVVTTGATWIDLGCRGASTIPGITSDPYAEAKVVSGLILGGH